MLALAEHGEFKFATLDHVPDESEIDRLTATYPFLLEDKFYLQCSPYNNPSGCSLTSQGLSISCSRSIVNPEAFCYNTVTGAQYTKAESEKIMSVLSRAEKLLVLRLKTILSNRYSNAPINAVPPQVNPIPSEDVNKKDADELSRIIRELRAKYGTPPVAPPPPEVKSKPTPIPVPPKVVTYEECVSLSQEFNFPQLIEAISSGNTVRAKQVLSQLVQVIIKDEKVLKKYKSYTRRISRCEREIEGK